MVYWECLRVGRWGVLIVGEGFSMEGEGMEEKNGQWFRVANEGMQKKVETILSLGAIWGL